MATFTDKPDANDILADSQSDIQDNFEYLQIALNKDHKIQFNVATAGDLTQGLHRQVSFINRSANPAVTASADSMLYSSSDNLYWKGKSAATGVILTDKTAGVPLNATNGVTFLPGGLLMQWGQSTTTSSAFPAAPTVTFPVAFSASPYSVQATIFNSVDAGKVVQVCAVTVADFTVTTRNTAGGTTFPVTYSWMAIGPA